MGNKNKKSRKGRTNPQQKISQLPVEQLVAQARNALDKGKAREAIDALKLAGKLDKNATIRHLLYRAYLLREDQLMSKGMTTEAGVVRKMAFSMMPSLDTLTEAELFDYISRASVQESLAACSEFSRNQPLPEQAETHIAYRLMMLSEWEALEVLESSHPLRRHSGLMQEAISLMNAGNWEGAIQILKDIPRVSPYTPIRLFCRAMAQFYQENDGEMLKTLSRIPDDFPLHIVIENLKRFASSPSTTQNLFGDAPVNLETTVQEITHAITHRQLKQAGTPISILSKTIFPANPYFAAQQILEMIFPAIYNSKNPFYDYLGLISSLLPHRLAILTENKLRFTTNRISPLDDGVMYLSTLKDEITDPLQRNMVFSMVMVNIAKKLNDFIRSPRTLLKISVPRTPVVKFLWNENDPEMILVRLVARACELDPLNRDAYEYLVSLPQTTRNARNVIEDILLKMADVFPEDPFPCLELASLYYGKNAFRKAENILAEASRRAPHDNRVTDRHALALLVSAWKNFQRKKYHLMEADFQRASQFNSRKVAPFLLEKQLLYNLTENASSFVISEHPVLLQLNALERLRILALLHGDIKAMPKKTFPARAIIQVDDYLSHELQALSQLTVTDIGTLLSPLPEEFRLILPSGDIAHTLLKKRPSMFNSISDSELIETFIHIFQDSILGFMADELKKRLKKKSQPHRLQMRFFLITIGHISGISYDLSPYLTLLQNADAETMRILETLSQKLSRHATGKIKIALEHFNFKEIDMGTPDLYDDDGVDDDRDDDEDIDSEFVDDLDAVFNSIDTKTKAKEIKKLRSYIESLIDKLDLRGASKGQILFVRKSLLMDKKSMQIFGMMDKFIDITGRDGLSREANILFPDKQTELKQMTLTDL